ncbi:EAL domain-containing protein [Micromonospora sp. WMMD1120]|uniref:EAL domain-containing protein n=1 Tax=Micromonospora sp. WMMD1120 TaxID=3016106 RepID=UPI002415E79E|nr:GGDEF domain-containing phosphodiesterase [Micromonospora sp. WMMD1120]MDG4807968.1 EAL domain-containing protein [Micromonospora sp. WMMD1120]
MNLDDILALAAQRAATPLERARARRASRQIQQAYSHAVTAGRDLVVDVDPHDPLNTDADEAARIARAAQLAKLGTITWISATGEISWSDEMSLILGCAPGTIRPSTDLLFDLVHAEDAPGVRRTIHAAWREQTVKETTYRVVRPDGTTRYVHCYIEVLIDRFDQPHGIIGTGQDVTDLELARQERDRLARRCETARIELISRDPATGLLTRPRFADEVDRTQRGGSGVLLVVAAEPLNLPNSGHDHAAQDRLAAAIAGVVKNVARRTAVCGLVGPGEFGVLLHNTTMTSATTIAESIIESLRGHSFVIGQHRERVRLDAWGGLVRYQDGDDSRGFDLLVDAESAWRQAKRQGLALTVLRQPARPEDRQETCRSRIRAAVAGNSFALYAQPILDLSLNQITRQEILLRVLDGTGQPVAPSAFLDVAERVDEIWPIDRWVIDHTMELIAHGPQTSHYQVNVSGRSLGDPHLLEHVHAVVKRHAIDPSQITFEITETALIGNLTQAIDFACGIRDIGCRLALDDFGSGYGTFTYLKYFPIDLVKIDGDFISKIEESRPDQVIVRSFVDMCRGLGIRTAAEFVGNDATLSLLRDYGVDFAQGYAVGKPTPVGNPHRALLGSAEIERAELGTAPRTAIG